MTQKISIPKPCHENWNDMLPEEQGKHCLVCSKTVVDFSSWNEHEILDYLSSKSNEKVCGRFNASQLESPSEKTFVLPIIFRSNISLLKKIAAIVLLCFGVIAGSDSYGQQKIVGKPAGPRTEKQQQLLGEPAVIKEDSTKKAPVMDTLDYQIMGKIAPYKPSPSKDSTTGRAARQRRIRRNISSRDSKSLKLLSALDYYSKSAAINCKALAQ